MRFTFKQASNNDAGMMESLTPAMFIAKYFEGKDSFREMVAELSEFAPTLGSNLVTFFSYVQEKLKVNSMITRRLHKKSAMPYIRFEVGMRNGAVPVMLFDCDKLSQFVEDYQRGVVQIRFSYDQLIEFVNS